MLSGLLGLAIALVGTGCTGSTPRSLARYDDLIWLPMSLEAQADSGDPEAQHAMGLRCEQSLAEGEAAAWYRRAAEQGHPGAQNNLGLLYFTGRGVERDHARALELYESAARQNDPSGLANLGIMHLFGHEVTQDRDRALQLLEEAAVLGNHRAQYLTAVLLLERDPGGQPGLRTIGWLEEAAKNGIESARRRLALLRNRASETPAQLIDDGALACVDAD